MERKNAKKERPRGQHVGKNYDFDWIHRADDTNIKQYEQTRNQEIR